MSYVIMIYRVYEQTGAIAIILLNRQRAASPVLDHSLHNAEADSDGIEDLAPDDEESVADDSVCFRTFYVILFVLLVSDWLIVINLCFVGPSVFDPYVWTVCCLSFPYSSTFCSGIAANHSDFGGGIPLFTQYSAIPIGMTKFRQN